MLAIKETNVCGWHAQKNPRPTEILLIGFNTRSFVARCRRKSILCSHSPSHSLFPFHVYFFFFLFFFLSLVDFIFAIKMQRVRLKSTSFHVNWILPEKILLAGFFYHEPTMFSQRARLSWKKKIFFLRSVPSEKRIV